MTSSEDDMRASFAEKRCGGPGGAATKTPLLRVSLFCPEEVSEMSLTGTGCGRYSSTGRVVATASPRFEKLVDREGRTPRRKSLVLHGSR
jgi:hypothetical protein